MTQSTLLEAAACMVSLTAVYLISEQSYLIGWSLNLYGDLMWILFGIIKSLPYLVLLQVVLGIICINGLMNL